MKRTKLAEMVVVTASVSWLAVSCASDADSRTPKVEAAGSAVAPPAAPSRPETPGPPSHEQIPLTDYRIPDAPKPDPEENPQTIVDGANRTFVVQPTLADYLGGAVIYNYVPNHLYELFVAPLELSTIELQAGEQIVAPVASGDTLDFMAGRSYDIESGVRREQVIVKAVSPGKETTLSVNTDRRNYLFRVVALESTWMPIVSFRYPMEVADLDNSQSDVASFGRLSDLDFGYEIVPHSIDRPAWAPTIVFSDGKQTYIDFASARRVAAAPVLFEVSPRGSRMLVNYRVHGTFYIVDRVLRHAELVLDVNDGNVISIVKREGSNDGE